MRTLRTLGDAERHFSHLRVTCRRCSHSALFRIDDMIMAVGRGRSPHRLPMRCSVCQNERPSAEFCSGPVYCKDEIIWRAERIQYRR
ncbi:hypothetical protein [Pararhizobium haloflavum]|uniref:hypothetical protein n=1 Tax=Pararhizobium haloflavum TaxID=2037914 RepID=UPI000C1A77DB|nr:hypothetical protein [Pararhizobium haloflavum]